MFKVKIGVIGCGRIAGLFHLPVLARMPGVELCALADPDPARLSAASALAPGPATFTSYERLIARSEAEAVVVCLPPALHAEVAVAAFDAGRHVYLEKPIALDLAGADDVVRAWRRAGTIGMTGFNFRFNPAFMAARKRLAGGAVGEVIAVRATFCSARRNLPDWKRSRTTGGGALRDLGAHHLDLVPHLLDAPVVRVSGLERSRFSEADTALLHLELASGVPVEVTLSMCTGVNANRIEVLGTAGRLVVEAIDALPNPIERAEGRHARLLRLQRVFAGLHPKRVLRSPGSEPSFAVALGVFVNAARAGRPVTPDIEDGRRCLAVVAAAERACALGVAQTVAKDAAPPAERASALAEVAP